jgi:hypothetical protein
MIDEGRYDSLMALLGFVSFAWHLECLPRVVLFELMGALAITLF